MNISDIVSFTQKIADLVDEAKTLGLNPGIIAQMCTVDQTFSNNVSQLLEMLTSTISTPTETTSTDVCKLCEDLLKRVMTDQCQPQPQPQQPIDHKSNRPQNIQRTFPLIPKPECLTKKGEYPKWEWKLKPDSNLYMVEVYNDEYDAVRMYITANQTCIPIFKKPDQISITGCKFDQLEEFMKHAMIPEELQEYIFKIIAL